MQFFLFLIYDYLGDDGGFGDDFSNNDGGGGDDSLNGNYYIYWMEKFIITHNFFYQI